MYIWIQYVANKARDHRRKKGHFPEGYAWHCFRFWPNTFFSNRRERKKKEKKSTLRPTKTLNSREM